MKINITKRKIMKTGEDEKIKIRWKQEEFEHIDKITYLGSIIRNKNMMD